jgi:pimeloyl-ACP methyl ester carboxylesterase
MRAVILLALATLAVAAPDEKRVRTALYELLKEKESDRKRIIESLADAGASVDEIEQVIRKGPLYPRDAAEGRKLVRVGGAVGGFEFGYNGNLYGYAVHVPSGYDPDKGSALLLDPGHGTWAKMSVEEKLQGFDVFRNHADAAGGRDWLIVRTEIVEQIGPDARGLPEEEGNRIFQLMFRDLATRYHFDPDRVYVAGLSQTGFWSWELGCCRADRFAGLAPMSAVTWEVNGLHANLLAVPVYALHGAKDKVCPVGQPRATCVELARIGVNVQYHELPNAGHDGNVWSTLPTALQWLKEHPRERYPKRVSKSLQTAKDGWCYWIRIDRLEDEGTGKAGEKPKAGIDGEMDGQVIRLHSEGVARISLCLASEMVDLDKPVTVIWNGKSVFEGKVERSLATMLDLVYDKTDWKETFEAVVELKAP